MLHILSLGEEFSPPDHARLLVDYIILVSDALCFIMQSMVLSRESISSVYAVVIAVRPRFATSSFTQSTGIHSDTVIGTALRRACGASCIRLTYNVQAGRPKNSIFFWPAFFTRLLTPGHENPAMGFFWDVDQDYRSWAF